MLFLIAGFGSCKQEGLSECNDYDFGPFGPTIIVDSTGLGRPLVCGSYLICYRYGNPGRNIIRIDKISRESEVFTFSDEPIGEMSLKSRHKICFTDRNRNAYLMDIMSGELSELGINSVRSPSWSFDGKYLAVFCNVTGRVVVFDSLSIPIDTILTDTPIGSVAYPTWSELDYTIALTIGTHNSYKVHKYDFESRTLADSSQSLLGLTNDGNDVIKSIVWLDDSTLLALNTNYVITCPLGNARPPGILSRFCDDRRLVSMDYHDGKLYCEVYSLLPTESGAYKLDQFVEEYDFPSLIPVNVYR